MVTDSSASALLPYYRPTPAWARIARFCRVLTHLAGGLATTVFVFPWIGTSRKRALIRRWSRQLLQMLNVRRRIDWQHAGGMRGHVLVVANHVSWLDIFVLNAQQPARFIAKAELARLPVIGHLCRNAGTLFIERERRRDTHAVNRNTVEALTRGDLVAVFPEGTTSDGTRVLKFHSSLFQPIVDARGVVQPIAIRYRTPADEYSDAPAFVGDLTMVGSLWRLTGEHSLVAEITILPQLPAVERTRRDLSNAAAAAIQTVLAAPAHAMGPDTRGGRRASPR
jgi:1-acyl-sn-glycerol-3-phosphate acyltransferase